MTVAGITNWQCFENPNFKPFRLRESKRRRARVLFISLPGLSPSPLKERRTITSTRRLSVLWVPASVTVEKALLMHVHGSITSLPLICMCARSVRSTWDRWKRPWSSWINQTRVCLTRSSFSTHAHACWRLETGSQNALKATVTPKRSNCGEGRLIRWYLSEIHQDSYPLHSANGSSDPFLRQKPLDICVKVYGVWSEEASQALQNGTEETIARGRGKFRNCTWPLVHWQCLVLKISRHVSRGSRGRRRILQGGPKRSDRSRPAPVETPLVLSYPPNLHLTLARPAPTDTTERLTITLTNDILVVMVGGIEIVRIYSTLRDNEHLFLFIYKSSQFSILMKIFFVFHHREGRLAEGP